MKEETYKSIENYFNKHKILYKFLNFFYKYLPLVIMFSYLPVACYFLIKFTSLPISYFVKMILIPAFVFIGVTLFREIFNFQRPYEKFDIKPLIPKDKKAHSFPSRHTASAFIIAMVFLKLNLIAGIIFLIISTFIAITRVLCGVHFIKDVLAGALISIITGLIFII